MSLLDDLQEIDISTVLSARGNISVALSNDDLQGLINGGAIPTALSGLGTVLSAIQNAQNEPQVLLMPVVDAVGDLAGHFDSGTIEIAEYIEVVRDGAQILSQIFALIGNGNPASFSIPNAGQLGDVLNHAANLSQHFSTVGFGEAANVKHLIDTVEQGFPSDPDQFAEYAIGLLMPFSASNLVTVRDSVNQMINGAAALSLDTSINAGVLASLERLRLAAEARNAVAVNQELAQLVNIRNNTLNAIRSLISRGSTQIQALNIESQIRAIENLADQFQVSPAGALEFMNNLRAQFAAIRTLVETVEFPELGPILDDVAEQAEALLRQNIEQPIDRAVNDIKTWLRNQLARLNLHYYRAQLTRFFKTVEQEIQAANLDGPAREARSFLDAIETAIANFDLNTEIQGALGDVDTTINDTVTTLQTSLQQIVDGVNAAAASAQAVLERVAELLEQFQQAIADITAAVEQLGIEQARDAVIDAIEELKDIAESILGVAPLPDAMRPLVEDVIRELDKVDVDEVLKPVFDALANLTIPPSVLEPINEVLDEAATVIQNLITEELIASLEQEFQSAIAELNKFDPSTLLSGVTDYFEEAAGFIEGLDPRPIVAEIRGPYDAVLQAIDAVHPNRLLRPVIEAYEGVFSAIEMPDPSESLGQLNQTLTQASEQIGQTVSQPLTRMTGQTARQAGDPPANDGPPDLLAEVRPGDIIRLLGYIPNKLREALQAMEAGPAGEVMTAISSLCSGLAQQLRQLQQQLWQAERQVFNSVETILKPLSSAQMQAQLALRANFTVNVSAGDSDSHASVDLEAAATLLGSLSSGAMRSELDQELAAARQNIATLIGHAGGSRGAFLERLADSLENCALADIGADLNALLDALDPEPLAAELDAVARAAINRLPEITSILDAGAQQAIERLILLMQQFNPVAQGLKFLTVLDVIREQLDLLNPRRLAAELAEIHGTIRKIILAYDPAVFAEEVYDLVETVSAQIRALDPGALLGDLTQFDNITATLEALSPAAALADIDDQLDEVGERLSEIDLALLLDAVNDLPGRVEESVTAAGQAVIDNLKALLASIEYFSGASASVSAEVSVG